MARSPVLWFLLLASPLAANDRYLVEFRDAPRLTAAAQRNTFARFRADLAQLDTTVSAKGTAPAQDPITHEYSLTLFGAAVRISRDALPRVRALPYVAGVYEDRVIEAHGRAAQGDAMRAEAVNLPTRGKGITIAIIDTGVDYNHPAIKPGYAGGYDFVNGDADPMDDSGHGTHVAGIAAGIAPEAAIVAYKVLGADGVGFGTDFVAALERAVDPNQDGNPEDHLDVVNMSFGARFGTADHPLSRAVDNTVAAGVVVVVSAGNSGSSVGSMGTPANANRAITVAALEPAGVVAFFSSRGPTGGLLTFKPDVAAPGVNITSARLGGGTSVQSGTSVAAPQVAGAAALLLALHPDWTPERVKSALVTTAAAVPNDAFARGAGALDVVAAAAGGNLTVTDSGLSFGINGSFEGTRTESRRFTIANRGASAQSLTFASAGAPSGCTVTVTPAEATLATGQAIEVTVQVVAENSALRPPSLAVIGGDVVVGGTSSFRIPWALVRGSRAIVRYDGELGNAVAFGDQFRAGLPLDESNAEFWVPSNLSEDFVVISAEEPARVLTTERRIAGDEVVNFTQSQATLKLDFQGRDHLGMRLADLPRVDDHRQQYVRFRIGSDAGFTAGVFTGTREIFATPIPSRLRLDTAEIYLDVDAMRGYVVNHRPMNGLTADVALTNDPYVNARLRWPAREFAACYASGETNRTVAAPEACLSRTGEDLRFDLYTTPEVNPERYVALLFGTQDFDTPPFRASNGTIVATMEPIPPAGTHRIAHGSETYVGIGPLAPVRFFGATEVPPNGLPLRGFLGPLGETMFTATATSFFTMRDASGAVVASGSLDTPGVQAPPSGPGYRLQVVSSGFAAARRNARGELGVQFGANAADLIAPTISSLQLLAPNGNPTETLQRGDAATLHFSAADYIVQGLDTLRTIAPKSAATRVSFRVSGSKEWRALPVVLTGSETGPRAKNLPSGDLYSVDMRDATAVNDAAIDLRVELEDNAGNHVTWSQEPAFVVGNPPPQARRRAR